TRASPMHKHRPTPLDIPIGEAPRRRVPLRSIAAIVVGLMMAPLLYEAVQCRVADWRAMRGEFITVRTPVIDALGTMIYEGGRGSRQARKGILRAPPWRIGPTVALSLLWAFGAALLLRGHHRR